MLTTIKQWLSFLTIKKINGQKGQSLVEMTMIAPVVIFLMLGVFEVGWALRGYLILTNVNREATRFAIRPGYLDFSSGDVAQIGYDAVYTHTVNSLAQRLPLDFQTNSKLIVTHMVVDTGLPCDPEKDISLCNCDEFTNPASNYNAAQEYTYDNLILHPQSPNHSYYVTSYPTKTYSSTLVNYQQEAAERARINNKFTCELLKKGGLASANNYITTEVFFEQPQLFGFPLISNPITDPVPLYSRTSMRITAAARDSTEADTVGPVCDAYPFVVHEDTLLNKLNQKVDIFDGNNGSDFGWLTWNPNNGTGSDSTPYMRDQLRTSRTPLNDYTNVKDPNDHILSVGDHVASMQGVKEAVESSDGLISALLNKKIRIPVWDTFSKGTGGDPDSYHISGFAWVMITSSSDINLPGKTVMATYLGDATDACSEGGPGGGSVPNPITTPTATLPAGSTPTATSVPPTATATSVPPTATATPTATPSPTITPSPTVQQLTLHIDWMEVKAQRQKDSNDNWEYRARVRVWVVDDNFNSIQDATVQGTWSGDHSGNVSDTTNGGGRAQFFTPYRTGNQWRGPYTFCVTSITKNGYTYNAGANARTCHTDSR